MTNRYYLDFVAEDRSDWRYLVLTARGMLRFDHGAWRRLPTAVGDDYLRRIAHGSDIGIVTLGELHEAGVPEIAN